MATRSERIVALAQAIGADIKAINTLIGDLTYLSTTEKTNLVGAINEIVSTSIGGIINDAGTVGTTGTTWSTDKIITALTTAKGEVRDELLGGASAALDTLNELATALNNDPNFATTISTALAKRVAVDAAQTFDTTEQQQARTNIGAVSQTDITTLYGDPDYDFLTEYAAAKL